MRRAESLTILPHITPLIIKMVKSTGTTAKHGKTTANKSKATPKPQAHKSGGQPKKGIHHRKRPASDGSDDPEGASSAPRVQPRKKARRVDEEGEVEVEVEEVIEEAEEENDEEVEAVDDNMGFEDVEEKQVSLL